MDLNKIKPLLENKTLSIGYELVSLTTKKEKGDNILMIVVDRVEPINMDDIVKVSEVLSNYLDEIDDSESPYVLDISSLGAEKPLKIECLAKYINRYVNVHLVNPIDGENIYEGTIKNVNDLQMELEIKIKTRVKTLVILLNNIYKIRLAIKF